MEKMDLVECSNERVSVISNNDFSIETKTVSSFVFVKLFISENTMYYIKIFYIMHYTDLIIKKTSK